MDTMLPAGCSYCQPEAYRPWSAKGFFVMCKACVEKYMANRDGEGQVRWVCVACGKKGLRKLGCVVNRDRAVCFTCWKAASSAWEAAWDLPPLPAGKDEPA